MTPFIASRYTCACRKASRVPVTGKFAGFLLGLFIAAPVLAAVGTDVSTDDLYSDDVTLTTFDGNPLDINLDGFTDLAVGINNGSVTSRYYLGNNDGTFQAPIGLDNLATSEIVAADFDMDGDIDLVQGVRDLNSRFWPNNGAGAFGTGVPILDTDRVLAIAVGDLDNDGDLDLVTGTGHPGGEPSTPDNLAPNRFYLNNTVQGTAPLFGVPGTNIAPDADDTRSIALADLDGDGLLDVIAGNDETTAGSNRIYLNQSTGANVVSFAAGVDFGPADDQTGKILIGDLNDDGLQDIVVLNFVATGSPGINRFFLNESTVGNLAFSQADISSDTNSSSGGALADFDGDGDLDVAVANVFGGTTARNRLYLNQFVESGTVSFVGSDISADEHQTRELAAGDIDGDTDIDLVAANQPLPGDADTDPVPGRDRVYLNNGSAAPFTDSEIPSFTSTPVTEATVGTEYSYGITTTDPEDDAVTIEAPVLPAWLTFTDNGDGTATLTGTPAAGDVGDHAVSIEVSDALNTATQDFTITVADETPPPPDNTAPSFTSTAVTSATEGEEYSYAVTASDADDDTLTITATTLPAWLTFTDNGDGTATLSGTPAADDVGDHDVTLEVSDGTDIAAQGFTIAVEAAASTPPPPPPANNDGGGGGGAFGALSLLVLAGLGAALRRRRAG